MAAPLIRADHDELRNIAHTFAASADLFAERWTQIGNCYERLRSGDWRGEGAAEFFAVMEGEIFPRFARLREALDEASEITKDVSRIFNEAEEGASQIFISG
jgi:WXG100 family type VII secretion target